MELMSSYFFFILFMVTFPSTYAERLSGKRRIFLRCEDCFGHGRNPTANKHCKGGCNRFVDLVENPDITTSKVFVYPTQFIPTNNPNNVGKKTVADNKRTKTTNINYRKGDITKMINLKNNESIFTSNIVVLLGIATLFVLLLGIVTIKRTYLLPKVQRRNRISFSDQEFAV